MQRDYDVIVIGSGPGGEGAAMKCAKAGKRVAVVEAMFEVGGNCTHRGTIPSKALRQIIQRKPNWLKFKDADYKTLLRHSQTVIEAQVTLRRSFYDGNDVDVLVGEASFVDPHTVTVSSRGGPTETYTADAFFLATGSRPYHPDDVDFTHPRILDSDTILKLEATPKSLTIYGAGVIGSEYASIFRGLGMKVNLINTRAQLLAFLDDEIIDALAYHLREMGVRLDHSEKYTSVEADDRGVTLNLESNKVIRSDYLLWANGRTGNSDRLGVDNLGLEPNSRGNLKVNESYQTDLPHIYAVGDLVGYPSLASAAYDQGRIAATHHVEGECDHKLVKDIPTGIYTIPEISSVGLNERELTEQKVPYEVGHAMFKHLARAQITGRTVGMLKILFHRETRELLGIHCFGDNAAEIVHIGQAIMSQPGELNTLDYFINTTFNYPTMAEAYRVAALNGLNRLG
ncbi:Si-specific NAD(P)(+) transhydrogenase [bacterium]|nr:Si-specific NAD(P)(+) transhydrogenase [bacterium]